MSFPERRRSDNDDSGMLMGGIALGILGGGAIGFVIACIAAATGHPDLFAVLVFGCGVLGGVVGAFHSLAGIAIAEAAVHLVAGFLAGIAEHWSPKLSEIPSWLRLILLVGLLLGLSLLFRGRWN